MRRPICVYPIAAVEVFAGSCAGTIHLNSQEFCRVWNSVVWRERAGLAWNSAKHGLMILVTQQRCVIHGYSVAVELITDHYRCVGLVLQAEVVNHWAMRLSGFWAQPLACDQKLSFLAAFEISNFSP